MNPLKNRIYDAFDPIKAEDKLKQDTYVFLQNRINRKKKTAFKRFAVSFAAAAILLFAGLFSYHVYFTETAFIDIEVNPSIELSLNRFERIINVYAYNDDGREVLNNVNIKNASYKDALKILIDKMIEMGYLSDSKLFSATLQINGGESEKELLDALKTQIDSIFQSQSETLEQDIFVVDSDTKTHAHEQNLTPVKYLAILELQSVDPTATFDSCRNHSIGEIKKQTRSHMNGGHGNQNNECESAPESNDAQAPSSSDSAVETNAHTSSGNSSKNHQAPTKTESHMEDAKGENSHKGENHGNNKHGKGH